jgi:hypothetical protein
MDRRHGYRDGGQKEDPRAHQGGTRSAQGGLQLRWKIGADPTLVTPRNTENLSATERHVHSKKGLVCKETVPKTLQNVTESNRKVV